MNISANFQVVPLSGTMGEDVLGNGVTGTSVHRIYCVSTGVIEIFAAGGGSFTFTANANEFVDVVVKSVIVDSGTFIGFKSKYHPSQFGPFN